MFICQSAAELEKEGSSTRVNLVASSDAKYPPLNRQCCRWRYSQCLYESIRKLIHLFYGDSDEDARNTYKNLHFEYIDKWINLY